MFGIGKWTAGLVVGVVGVVAPASALVTTAFDGGAEAAYRALDDLPVTASSLETLEDTAVRLAYELGEVPVSADSRGTSCPLERLEVSWERPVGYAQGAYVEPVGPPPTARTTHVTGVVVCADSTFAFMGFEADRDDDGTWHLASIPSIPDETDLEAATGPLAPGTPPGAATLPGLATGALGPVDPYAAYEPQRICDPAARPGTVALATLLLERFPSTHHWGITRPCEIGGRSEHKEGRAFDWGASINDPTERAAVEDFLGRLLATDAHGNRHALARRMGVMYVIWDNAIWASYRPDAGWRPYFGASDHTDHVHMSLSWDGATGRTSLWQATLPEGWWTALPSLEGDTTGPFGFSLALAGIDDLHVGGDGVRSESSQGTAAGDDEDGRLAPRQRPSPRPSGDGDGSGVTPGAEDVSDRIDDPAGTVGDVVEEGTETVGDAVDDVETAGPDVTDTIGETVTDTASEVIEDVRSPLPSPTIADGLLGN